MKTIEYTINELMNIGRMFNDRELYALCDKSENQQFEEGDLCILSYTLIVTFVSKTQHDGYTEYKLRDMDGYEFNMCDYEHEFSLYHLEIPRNLYETEWDKFNKKKEAKMLQMENECCSQKMATAMKEYEDILSELKGRASRVECTEDSVNTDTESESEHRPFWSRDECWNEMKKHPDFGWVKYDDSICAIQSISPKGVTITDWAETNSFYFEECLENLTFTDDTPFGIKE